MNKKRAAIYFFFDEDGVVDGYVEYYLKELKKVTDYILVVVNGKLNSDGKKLFERNSDYMFVRENVGFDAWAMKAGIEHIGFEKLKQYDELILTNFTVFGPVYPFSEMFGEMEKSDVDFWGVFKKFENKDVIGYGGRPTPYGYVPEFITSNFVVIRSRMLNSYEFQKYWLELPLIEDYFDSINLHEPVFTRTMFDKGFTYTTYDNIEKLSNWCPSPTVNMAHFLVKERRCPIFRRRVFTSHFIEYINLDNGNDALDLLDFVKNETSYDVNLIWDNLLRTTNQNDLRNRLHLNYILPKDMKTANFDAEKLSIAVILHVYYVDLAEYCYNYLKNMPKSCHLYITTDSESKLEELKEVFNKLNFDKTDYRIVQNRGRDVSALLVGCKDVVLSGNYKYICFLHDKKVPHARWEAIGRAFSDKCFDNLAGSSEYVNNVLNLFETNPRLGLLSSMPPIHERYFAAIGGLWGDNFKGSSDLVKKLGYKTPIDKNKPPIAPYGTMFWFRTGALKSLFEQDFKYNDFPEEPTGVNDGTIMHCIERLYPFTCQDSGFYPAYAISDYYARLDITCLTYILHEINQIGFRKFNGRVPFNLFLHNLRAVSLSNTAVSQLSTQDIAYSLNTQTLIKLLTRKFTPRPLWNLMHKIKMKGK